MTVTTTLTDSVATFDPTPSVARGGDVTVTVARAVPASADAVGVPVGTRGAVARQLGLDRASLTAAGFDGKVGQTLVVPRRGGGVVVALGVGDDDVLTPAQLRDVAAAFARAAAKHGALATTLADLGGPPADVAAQAVVEGILLGRYRYGALKKDVPSAGLRAVILVCGSARAGAVERGAARGRITAGAAQLARDLANTPPGHLTASRMADVATAVAASSKLQIETFDAGALAGLGCGGLLGVNAGSTEPPRMIKLSYRPAKPTGHLAMVGKGVMYDSGGISLKNSDAMHAAMKMDMSGAAAVLSAMSVLAALKCRTAVTGYLMCTDNMPSGSAMKLGDVLTIRGGTTVEIHNTDAEGRLVLADGLALAVEERPDAVVDIATLTGACMVALGAGMAGVFGTSQPFVDQVAAAATAADELVWQLPLFKEKYRKQLDSDVADLKNVGGPYGGAINAAVFLSEFVGDVPWAHLDIAGPMKVDADESWRSKGATGFGTRLLIDLATNFTAP
jgi:leucyl aminopeptidase